MKIVSRVVPKYTVLRAPSVVLSEHPTPLSTANIGIIKVRFREKTKLESQF